MRSCLRIPALPAARGGVQYDLHVQQAPDVLPSALEQLAARPDVRVLACAGTGAARSRNAALAAAQSALLLFADDDMVQDVSGQDLLRQQFADDPLIDILCARLYGSNGQPHKAYGPDGQNLRFWNGARVGTPEIALRLQRVRNAGLQFDESFGAGTAIPLGDEYIFLMDCRRAGLTGRHVDIPVGVHPPHSSGLVFDRDTLPWRRAVFRRALGWFWRPAYALFLVRNRHRLPPR
jgi:hypothetical protein